MSHIQTEGREKSLSLYFHVPFCLQKCRYCDFYSASGSDMPLRLQYADALRRELGAWREKLGAREIATVYFGGGTPTVLPPRALIAVLDTAKSLFPFRKDAEITFEANPASIGIRELAALREGGFTRISAGVQSLMDSELAALGRMHTAEEALSFLREAKEAGFQNRSADLMLGIPYQTADSLARTLDGLIGSGVPHISAYMLTVEKGTPLDRMIKNGELPPPDEEVSAALYEQASAAFAEAGLSRYEISNFAKKGFESRHNLAYWKLTDYLGIGPSAHSLLDGKRFSMECSTRDFIAGETKLSYESEGGGAGEYLMLGLRLAEGISLSEIEARGGDTAALLRKARFLAEKGLLSLHEDTGRIALTTEGVLISNPVIGELLDAAGFDI